MNNLRVDISKVTNFNQDFQSLMKHCMLSFGKCAPCHNIPPTPTSKTGQWLVLLGFVEPTIQANTGLWILSWAEKPWGRLLQLSFCLLMVKNARFSLDRHLARMGETLHFFSSMSNSFFPQLPAGQIQYHQESITGMEFWKYWFN